MPMVNGKSYSYDEEGKAAAKKAQMSMDTMKSSIAKKKAMKNAGSDKPMDMTRKTNPFIPSDSKKAKEKFGYEMNLRKGRKINVKGTGK